MNKKIRIRIILTTTVASFGGVGIFLFSFINLGSLSFTNRQLVLGIVIGLALLLLVGIIQFCVNEVWFRHLFRFNHKKEMGISPAHDETKYALDAAMNFPLRSSLLSLSLWLIPWIFFSFYVLRWLGVTFEQQSYLFLSISAGGLVAFIFQLFTFKHYLQPIVWSINREAPVFERSSEEKTWFLNIREKLIILFLVLSFFSLFFSSLINYIRISEILNKNASRFGLRELNRITDEMEDYFSRGGRLKNIHNLLNRIASSGKGDLYLIDNNKDILFGPQKKGFNIHEIDIPDLDTIRDGHTIKLKNRDLVVLLPVSGKGWYIARHYRKDSIKAGTNEIILKSIGLIIIGLFLAILLALLVSRDVLNPVLGMVDVSRSMSSGDLSRDVEILTEDEVGELALGFKRMVGNLRGMIESLEGVSRGLVGVAAGISESSRTVSVGSSSQVGSVDVAFSSIGEIDGSIQEIAGQTELLNRSAGRGLEFVVELDRKIEEISFDVDGLSGSVDETTSSISEMSASVKEVADSVDESLSLAGETASAMVEMDASIKQVEENAAETARVSQRVMGDAEGGMEAVRMTIDGMERIKDVSEHAFDVIKVLSERVGEIGRILTLINEVAEDTNLLALNAAIIAAKAGESGRSFAVIADEISELARRTEAHIEDISNIIGSVQVESGRALEAVRDGVSVVEEGVTLSGRAGDALDKILGGSRLSLGMVKQIAMACGEQAISSRRVSEAMERVRGMVEAIARATSEQSRGGEQIEVAVEKMRELSLRVKGTIKEQSGFSKNVISNLEKIKEMINLIDTSTKGQGKNIEKVINSVATIRDIAGSNEENVLRLDNTVSTLNSQSEELQGEIGRFKI